MSSSPVTEVPAAASEDAVAHFSALRAFETDCWDVHAAMAASSQDFVLLDVRSPESYAAGHVPGAVNLPHGRIVERNLEDWPAESLFVVYCAGPHCNGADKAALRLARLGRSVKKMIGGVSGWLDEGFELERHLSQPRRLGRKLRHHADRDSRTGAVNAPRRWSESRHGHWVHGP